jgi:hypothetical protein
MDLFNRAGVAMLQPHPLSLGRVIFLVAIVVTFCVLFIGFYVWMRRPAFGQGARARTFTGTDCPDPSPGPD